MMDLNAKLRQVCEEFRIEGVYESYEEIKVGNVNRTLQGEFCPRGRYAQIVHCTAPEYLCV